MTALFHIKILLGDVKYLMIWRTKIISQGSALLLHLTVATLAEQQLVVQLSKGKFPASGGLLLPFSKFIAHLCIV